MYLVTWTTSDGEILGEKQATKEDARYQLKELFFQYAPEGYRREDIAGYLDWKPRHKVIEKDGDIFADGSDQEGLEMRDRHRKHGPGGALHLFKRRRCVCRRIALCVRGNVLRESV